MRHIKSVTGALAEEIPAPLQPLVAAGRIQVIGAWTDMLERVGISMATQGEVPWLAGPWDDEPWDKAHFIDLETDMDCLIVRGGMGTWCGYVGVDPGHPWHGVGYGICARPDLHESDPEPSEDNDYTTTCWDHSPGAQVLVHGGLTFSEYCAEGGLICHVPQAGRPGEVYWFGFDCHHGFDSAPGMALFDKEWGIGAHMDLDPEFRSHYRDMSYVVSETLGLAKQLAAVGAATS